MEYIVLLDIQTDKKGTEKSITNDQNIDSVESVCIYLRKLDTLVMTDASTKKCKIGLGFVFVLTSTVPFFE